MVVQGAISDLKTTSQNNPVTSVGSQLSKKVTTGNPDETMLSDDTFTLVISFSNISKD